jgi:hypothetical protein
VAQGDKLVGQWPTLLTSPGVEGGHELGLVDQPSLKRQQSEEEVSRWVDMNGHDRQLPSLLSAANNPGDVPHMVPRKEVTARGCIVTRCRANCWGFLSAQRTGPLGSAVLVTGHLGTLVDLMSAHGKELHKPA